MVRPPGPRRLQLPQLGQGQGRAARPVRRPAGDRHLQHLQRADAVQLAFPHARRAGQDRRLRSRRLPARVSGDVARRDATSADGDAVPQPRLDGRRGIDPRQSGRRRRAPDGLRQDDAVAGDGRIERRPADDRRLGRPDAQRQVARQGARLGHGRLEHERAGARRHAQAAGLLRRRELHAPQPWPLHDDGNGVDDGLDGRSARPRPARQRRLSRGRRQAQRAGADGRPAHRRHGPRGPEDLGRADARGVRERDRHAGGDRRLDQRRDPPDRDRRPARRQARHRRLREARERAAVPGQPAAVGQAPDGGLLLRRRAAGGDEGNGVAAAPRRRHRQRQDRRRQHRGRRELQHRRHQAVQLRRSRPTPESLSCAGTSHRAARSSSRARRRRR